MLPECGAWRNDGRDLPPSRRTALRRRTRPRGALARFVPNAAGASANHDSFVAESSAV